MKKSILSVLFYFFLINLYGQSTHENLFDVKKGAKVVDFSSNYEESWDVQNVLANSENTSSEGGALPVWCTAAGAAFPHFVTVQLAKTEWLDIIVFNNKIADESGWPGISAKDVEVYVSNTSAKSEFKKVVSFRLENNKDNQVVKIMPVQAKWVKFIVKSNYGNNEYTELGQVGVYDDKIRTASLSEELNKKGYIDLYGLYFDFGSADLRPESELVIQQIATYLKENPTTKLTIEGHTDNVGSEPTNQQLSEKRAATVRNELVKKGVITDRLFLKGFGSKQPVAENSSSTGRAQNRRVTIRKS